MGWDGDRLQLESLKTSSFRYFVRIKGIAEKRLEEVKNVFGNVDVTELDHMDEFAVLTESMTEEEYEQKARELSGIRQMIRAEL